MASVFTYQEDVKRIHSPWSTPGNTTPQSGRQDNAPIDSGYNMNGITRLEPEKQEGPCEYKLHLLLRARRKFVLLTTTTNGSSSLHTATAPTALARTISNDYSFQKSTYQPSSQSRQSRLQQLTTQLLWRLQQSSPFHSSSNAQLVLPVLPEATPRLGVPERPAKLLPGLEESQGALYELGVADDGTLIGLIQDELDESLNNLRAMAASLGCVCDVLLKVGVGQCEWDAEDAEGVRARGELFVAEVLVRPDSRAAFGLLTATSPKIANTLPPTEVDADSSLVTTVSTQQLRVAFAGSSTAGKSSLVGTLATSVLDNGRGKSRLSLLKHRHEIASGITSSVAHELIGYKTTDEAEDFVINYATGDISSWTDVHNLGDRLCFLIDSPGLPRYAKSIFRSLLSWKPQWVIFCIAADEDDDSYPRAANRMSSGDGESAGYSTLSEMSLAHLSLLLRLDLPIIVAVTKMDAATKSGLRTVLGKVLSALKTSGRQPILLSSPSNPVTTFALDSNQALPDLQHITTVEETEMDRTIGSIEKDPSGSIVPIVMTSSVTGSGLGKLHSLLRNLPNGASSNPGDSAERTHLMHQSLLFHIDEVFSIPPSKVYSSEASTRLESQGVVLCGRLARAKISVGDMLRLGPLVLDGTHTGTTPTRSKSYSAQDMRRSMKGTIASLARSLQDDSVSIRATSTGSSQGTAFVAVRVVSLRNLRLPVLTMHEGNTGTIGIELVQDFGSQLCLERVRKGMVLLSSENFHTAYRSFTAVFPATDFVSSSPPLILGGHAIAYVNSIRAAVKVTAVALADEEGSSSPTEVFAFDGDDDEEPAGDGRQESDIRITFRFVSTVEWMDQGDQVLVVPTVSMSGPVAGSVATTNGLAGFVGSISELQA